jgi:hypothetical protein
LEQRSGQRHEPGCRRHGRLGDGAHGGLVAIHQFKPAHDDVEHPVMGCAGDRFVIQRAQHFCVKLPAIEAQDVCLAADDVRYVGKAHVRFGGDVGHANVSPGPRCSQPEASIDKCRFSLVGVCHQCSPRGTDSG